MMDMITIKKIIKGDFFFFLYFWFCELWYELVLRFLTGDRLLCIFLFFFILNPLKNQQIRHSNPF